MANRDQIVEQALSLAPEDRAYVADALEQSLASSGFASPEVTEAWAEEVERRLAAYDRGDIKAIDGASWAHLRKQLADRRAQGAKA
ncbi:MAG TPA: addiction module protein [Pirellulales bacterium]|jgi:putative addiction module component (TIGR02574 family)